MVLWSKVFLMVALEVVLSGSVMILGGSEVVLAVADTGVSFSLRSSTDG